MQPFEPEWVRRAKAGALAPNASGGTARPATTIIGVVPASYHVVEPAPQLRWLPVDYLTAADAAKPAVAKTEETR